MDSEDIVKITEDTERVDLAREFEAVLKPQALGALDAIRKLAKSPGMNDDSTFAIPLDANTRPIEFSKLSPVQACFGAWLQDAGEGAPINEKSVKSCSGNEGITLQEIEFVLDHFAQAVSRVSKDPITLPSGPPPLPRQLKEQKNIERFMKMAKIYFSKKNKTAWKSIEGRLRITLASLQALAQTGNKIWKRTDDSGTGHYIYRPLQGQSARLDVVAIAKGLNCLKLSGVETELPSTLTQIREVLRRDPQVNGERLPASH